MGCSVGQGISAFSLLAFSAPVTFLAIFIGLIQNGMNLARIESYLQTVVIGVLLILAVIADQFRQRYIAKLQD